MREEHTHNETIENIELNDNEQKIIIFKKIIKVRIKKLGLQNQINLNVIQEKLKNLDENELIDLQLNLTNYFVVLDILEKNEEKETIKELKKSDSGKIADLINKFLVDGVSKTREYREVNQNKNYYLGWNLNEEIFLKYSIIERILLYDPISKSYPNNTFGKNDLPIDKEDKEKIKNIEGDHVVIILSKNDPCVFEIRLKSDSTINAKIRRKNGEEISLSKFKLITLEIDDEIIFGDTQLPSLVFFQGNKSITLEKGNQLMKYQEEIKKMNLEKNQQKTFEILFIIGRYLQDNKAVAQDKVYRSSFDGYFPPNLIIEFHRYLANHSQCGEYMLSTKKKDLGDDFFKTGWPLDFLVNHRNFFAHNNPHPNDKEFYQKMTENWKDLISIINLVYDKEGKIQDYMNINHKELIDFFKKEISVLGNTKTNKILCSNHFLPQKECSKKECCFSHQIDSANLSDIKHQGLIETYNKQDKKKICPYNLYNLKCPQKVSCPSSHLFKIENLSELDQPKFLWNFCWNFFWNLNGCKSSDCKYRHSLHVVNLSDKYSPQQKNEKLMRYREEKKSICRYYFITTRCKYDNCKYSHELKEGDISFGDESIFKN